MSAAALDLDVLVAALEPLLDALGVAAQQREGALWITPAGGEGVRLAPRPEGVEAEFAGWRTTIELEGELDGELDECLALVRDFVAAAMLGELRVVAGCLDGRVIQASVECLVEGRWRRHERWGRLGLAGLRARIAGRLEQRVRCNGDGVPRPPALRQSGPRGLPSAPWIGAAEGLGDDAHEATAALPLDGELDLHNFSPKEVGPLVREYIEACRGQGILDLRVVHGKGKGVLRRTVHAQLDRHPAVESYRLGGAGEGSWGATIVRLRAPE